MKVKDLKVWQRFSPLKSDIQYEYLGAYVHAGGDVVHVVKKVYGSTKYVVKGDKEVNGY